jgi:hypothetical protein
LSEEDINVVVDADKLKLLIIVILVKIKVVKMDFIVYVKVVEIRKKDKKLQNNFF